MEGLIFQSVNVMEQTERSDDLIHNWMYFWHKYLHFSDWNVKFCNGYEPPHVEIYLQVFPRPTQSGHYSLPQKMARGLKFGFRNKRDSTFYVAKTKVW